MIIHNSVTMPKSNVFRPLVPHLGKILDYTSYDEGDSRTEPPFLDN